jgi:hypothetical protein
MKLLDLVPAPYRNVVLALLCLLIASGTAAFAWQIQSWRYGQLLDRQARLQADTLHELALAGATLQREEQAKRLALEQRLKASDDNHYSELSNAQEHQKRVRDQLATTQLRLSVLLAATDSGGCSMSASAGAVGLVHDSRRAELEPAHAQRIIGITDDGDRGLIALKACQAYAREVSSSK